MALKGNLRDFTISQLLNLIHLAGKTGSLTVDGTGDRAWVAFRDGKLAYARMESEDDGLVAILYRAKKLTRAQYKVIKSRSGTMSDKELGLLLINANYLTQEDILASLRNAYVSVLERLFTWVEGLFTFEDGFPPLDGKITLQISLENIIIDASRRLREWEQLQDEIPSLDVALKFTDRPGADLRNVNLSVEEWRVVSYIDPKNTLKKIAAATKMNDLEIRRIVYGLLQAGLVEMVRPEGAKMERKKPMLPVSDPEEQISLVNRIIHRIRSL